METCLVCRRQKPAADMSRSSSRTKGWCKLCVLKYPPMDAPEEVKPPKGEVYLEPYQLVGFRARYSLTQTGFAQTFGVATPTVSSWEQGYTKIPKYIVMAMSAFVAGLPPYSG